MPTPLNAGMAACISDSRDATRRMLLQASSPKSATASEDPLLALAQREANVLGKERLLAALLGGAGLQARVVRGLELGEGERRGGV